MHINHQIIEDSFSFQLFLNDFVQAKYLSNCQSFFLLKNKPHFAEYTIVTIRAPVRPQTVCVCVSVCVCLAAVTLCLLSPESRCAKVYGVLWLLVGR